MKSFEILIHDVIFMLICGLRKKGNTFYSCIIFIFVATGRTRKLFLLVGICFSFQLFVCVFLILGSGLPWVPGAL